MKWSENTIREEVKDWHRCEKRGRRRKERDIERRAKEGTGKTYKQIDKGKRTFVAFVV